MYVTKYSDLVVQMSFKSQCKQHPLKLEHQKNKDSKICYANVNENYKGSV